MTFHSSILAGTVLTRAAMQSPNYVQGTTGWKISQDGTAEFNNITARGSITATSLTAGSPTGAQIVINQTSGLGTIKFPTNAAEESQASSMNSGRANQGAANEFLALDIIGPAVTGHTDYVWTALNSQAKDGSSNANLSFNYNSGGTNHSIATMDKTQVTFNEPVALNGATTVFNNFAVTGTTTLAGAISNGDVHVNGSLYADNIATGTITFNNSADQTVVYTGNITFPVTYRAIPLVFMTAQNDAFGATSTIYMCQPTAITTTGCQVKFYRNTSTGASGQTFAFFIICLA